jgi:hypothetical protein
MTTVSRGYLTVAARHPRFLEMAVDMCLSLREHTALPIALASDEGLAEVARARYSGVFDEVTLIPERFREGRALKYGVAEASPYEETAFVDADCFVLGPLDGAFASLAGHDMAMTGEHLGPHDDRVHHGFSTTWLIRRFGLETYLKTNSGFFCFRRSKALEIMEECRVCYLEEVLGRLRWTTLLGKWLGDELAFGIVGARRRLAVLPASQHMYWPEEFPALDLERPSKPLLHIIWPLAPVVLETLIRRAAERRAAAGLPDPEQGEHWRDEVRRLGRLSRRRRLFGRVGWY